MPPARRRRLLNSLQNASFVKSARGAPAVSPADEIPDLAYSSVRARSDENIDVADGIALRPLLGRIADGREQQGLAAHDPELTHWLIGIHHANMKS